MKKYLVIAGRIPSKHDKDVHKISGRELCELYGIDPEECLFADEDDPRSIHITSGLIILRPRYDGDYRQYLEEIL